MLIVGHRANPYEANDSKSDIAAIFFALFLLIHVGGSVSVCVLMRRRRLREKVLEREDREGKDEE